jgi:hypothetical protein
MKRPDLFSVGILSYPELKVMIELWINSLVMGLGSVIPNLEVGHSILSMKVDKGIGILTSFPSKLL